MANADKKKKNKPVKKPFFKSTSNVIMLVLTVGMLVFMVFYKGEDGLSGIERLFTRVRDTAVTVTEGCQKPPNSEVEAHFKDNSGSIPVAKDFDADPDEICGNGKTYYCTSKPPKKPIPLSWKVPPLPGTDPNYKGPSPFDEFKESPYAMPAPKITLSREPIKDRGDDALKDALADALSRSTGKLGYLGKRRLPNALEGQESSIITVNPRIFESNDDALVAKQLKDQGIEMLLVDRTSPVVAPWIEEKMDTVRIRLRDAVSLKWFHPAVLGSGWALYRMAPPVEIPRHIKRRLTSRVRALLKDEDATKIDFSLPNTGDKVYRVVVSLRKRNEPKLKGRKLVRKIEHGNTLIDALDHSVDRIKKDWGKVRRNNKKSYDFDLPASLAKAMDEIEVEIDVMYDICHLTDRRAKNLLWYVELGLEGLMLQKKKGNKEISYLEPSYAVQMEKSSEVVFLESMLKKSHLKQFLRPARKKKIQRKRGNVLWETEFAHDKDFNFKRFRSVNWVEKTQADGGDIVEIYRGMPLKTIWDVTKSSLVRSLELGAQWLMNNQTPDGQYKYKYTPTNKPGRRWTAGGNIVRHALNPYTLLMVNKAQQNPRYVESAKRGIDFSLSFLRHKGDRCCICHRDPPARYYNAKLNAVAVTVLSILKLADVADISEYKQQLDCMAQEILYMQDKNGHFRQYDVPFDHPYYGAESTIHAGEFIFVLARLYNYYKEEKYKTACDNALTFYMQLWRKLLKERTPTGIFDEEHRVNLIGIVPWLVTAMEDLHRNTNDQQYADIAFEAQNWIDKEFFWWPNRAQYPDYVGASYKVHKELPAVNSCQYAEGAAAAYEVSKRTNTNVEERRLLLIQSMRFCLQLQYDGYENTFFLPVPEEAMGGYHYTLGHLRIRNDYNYHAMAAIAQAVDYLLPEDYPAERPIMFPPVLDALLGGQPNPTKNITMKEYIEAKAASVQVDGGTGDSNALN